MNTLKKYEKTKTALQDLKPRSQRRAVVQSQLTNLMTSLLKQEVRQVRRKSK